MLVSTSHGPLRWRWAFFGPHSISEFDHPKRCEKMRKTRGKPIEHMDALRIFYCWRDVANPTTVCCWSFWRSVFFLGNQLTVFCWDPSCNGWDVSNRGYLPLPFIQVFKLHLVWSHHRSVVNSFKPSWTHLEAFPYKKIWQTIAFLGLYGIYVPHTSNCLRERPNFVSTKSQFGGIWKEGQWWCTTKSTATRTNRKCSLRNIKSQYCFGLATIHQNLRGPRKLRPAHADHAQSQHARIARRPKPSRPSAACGRRAVQ